MTNSVAQIALLLGTESYRLHQTLSNGRMAGQTGHAILSDALAILADYVDASIMLRILRRGSGKLMTKGVAGN